MWKEKAEVVGKEAKRETPLAAGVMEREVAYARELVAVTAGILSIVSQLKNVE
jgi:hypothetical protein